MKKIKAPVVDDEYIAELLSDNDSLSSYPILKEELNYLKQNYEDYSINSGNPWNVNPVILDDTLGKALISHYNSTPKGLEFIKTMRDKCSPNICPMCGSQSTFNLDHYLPKKKYPEFSIFSKNLIPACSCNLKRGEAVKGDVEGQRTLHPYFDDCLSDRIVSCQIKGDLDYPSIEVVNIHHATDNLAIEYHVESIIKKTTINNWLDAQWSMLIKKPVLIIRNIPNDRAINVDEMKGYIEKIMDYNEELLGTKNNWESILLHGLLNNDDALEWVKNKHNLSIFKLL